ncbi:MAG: hypothetical protein RR561_03890 [Peptostreptococcus sp.]|uniref:hypothetical protein n=1 Tax=Peptostreptococcus sp. TaxID=1262 RepID=UPI002FCCA5ED
MKNKLLALILITSTLLVGCKEKVYEDQRMGDSRERSMKIEYNIYTANIIDSGYNWYSNFVNEFLESIKDRDYKVDPSFVNSQIKKVEIKKKEVSDINTTYVKNAINKVSEDISKGEKNDKKFKKTIKSSKENINKNKDTMENMLVSIEDALKLGLDGSYNEEDLSKMKDLQINLIKTYDEKLRDNN